jgi:hypothetical protein
LRRRAITRSATIRRRSRIFRSSCLWRRTSAHRDRSSSTSMRPMIRCAASRRGGSSTVTTTATATYRSMFPVAAICWSRSCGARRSSGRRRGRGGRAHRGADPPPVATRAHSVACRLETGIGFSLRPLGLCHDPARPAPGPARHPHEVLEAALGPAVRRLLAATISSSVVISAMSRSFLAIPNRKSTPVRSCVSAVAASRSPWRPPVQPPETRPAPPSGSRLPLWPAPRRHHT